ncbi:MAG TPA: nitrite reductase small subunit NirD [Cryptosporangiaceae bacterium]|nr:nitrite reductase small subunit NirD [Cryptosporangiaceae bacterium]
MTALAHAADGTGGTGGTGGAGRDGERSAAPGRDAEVPPSTGGDAQRFADTASGHGAEVGSPEVGSPDLGWVAVCRFDELEPERGVAAMVGGRQVALFRTWDGSLHALDHLDPVSGAYVIARGIVGTRGDTPTVASPMHKQVYDLTTGQCLDDATLRLATYSVRVRGGVVEIAVGVAREPLT